MAIQSNSAKQKFVDAALDLFSERGFYGVSLADVANEVGLTKQSVLHHFNSKEALYREVLRQLSERFQAIVDAVKTEPVGGEQRFEIYLGKLHAHMQAEPRDARLIARELLDNLERADASRKWYLRAFLDDSVALLSAHADWRDRSAADRATAVYQMIGAINYFAISGATLKGIWGPKRSNDMAKAFLPALLARAAKSP